MVFDFWCRCGIGVVKCGVVGGIIDVDGFCLVGGGGWWYWFCDVFNCNGVVIDV